MDRRPSSYFYIKIQSADAGTVTRRRRLATKSEFQRSRSESIRLNWWWRGIVSLFESSANILSTFVGNEQERASLIRAMSSRKKCTVHENAVRLEMQLVAWCPLQN
jgi:hypothetical protein